MGLKLISAAKRKAKVENKRMMKKKLVKHKQKIISAMMWFPVFASTVLAGCAAYAGSGLWCRLWLLLLCFSGYALFLVKPWEYGGEERKR